LFVFAAFDVLVDEHKLPPLFSLSLFVRVVSMRSPGLLVVGFFSWSLPLSYLGVFTQRVPFGARSNLKEEFILETKR
jgi:hypothetical protein